MLSNKDYFLKEEEWWTQQCLHEIPRVKNISSVKLRWVSKLRRMQVHKIREINEKKCKSFY